MHTMQVGGHSWAENPLDPGSRRVALRGGITTGSTVNIHIPSTSPSGARGDYQYGDVFGNETLSGGSWGILRVYNKPSALTAGIPTTIGAVDTPYSTAHPLMPLTAAG